MKKYILTSFNFIFFFLCAFSQSKDSIPELISASKNNDIAKVKTILLKQSKDLNAIYEGYTPLLYAVKNENFEMVQLLVDKGADVNLSVNFVSPMWLADIDNWAQKQSNNNKLILNLLTKRALKKITNTPNIKEIRQAIDTTLRKTLKYPYTAIRIYKIFPDNTFNGSIRVLCDAAVYDKVTMYEKVRITKNPMDEPLPNLASHLMIDGAYDFVFRLSLNSKLKWEANLIQLNQISDSILQELNSIIKEKSNPNAKLSDGTYPLISAIISEDKDLMLNLINLGADGNLMNSGFSALHLACLNGYLSIVETLILKGANIEQTCTDGANCLILASQSGHSDIVEFLIKKGLSPNCQKQNGSTPLILASILGHNNVVNVLLNNYADPNYTVPGGDQTALIYASLFGWDKIVKLLVTKKANVNAADKYVWTPLLYACQNGFINIVNILIYAGADKGIKTPDGFTPADIAKEGGYLKIIELLKNTNVKK